MKDYCRCGKEKNYQDPTCLDIECVRNYNDSEELIFNEKGVRRFIMENKEDIGISALLTTIDRQDKQIRDLQQREIELLRNIMIVDEHARELRKIIADKSWEHLNKKEEAANQ